MHLVREGPASWIGVLPGAFGGWTVGLGVKDFGSRVVETMECTNYVV